MRFVYFVATIKATDLRVATTSETAQVKEWLRAKQQRYGGEW
ncbi:hypothetical protein [Streptomyces sp. NPDC090025]